MLLAPAVGGAVLGIASGAMPVAILFLGPLADVVPVESLALTLVGVWYR